MLLEKFLFSLAFLSVTWKMQTEPTENSKYLSPNLLNPAKASNNGDCLCRKLHTHLKLENIQIIYDNCLSRYREKKERRVLNKEYILYRHTLHCLTKKQMSVCLVYVKNLLNFW